MNIKKMKEFEKDTGYNFTDCNKCVNDYCKKSGICSYWREYASWLENKLLSSYKD